MPGQEAVSLTEGETMTFGRRASGRQVDLEVSDSVLVSRRAGTVELTPYGVLVTNTGSNPLLLEEGSRSVRSSLRRGGAQLVLTGRARVSFAGTPDSFEVEVVSQDDPDEESEPVPLAAGHPSATGERTRPAWSLSEDTAYFHCLVALCEPTLRNPDSPWIPTSQQVADRLWQCRLLPGPRSGDWVDRRLDDVREKLPIGEKPWTADRARSATPTEQAQAVAR
ncbi:MAG TPA: hypothetical protein VFX70_20705, partial [Mycobacteriales bacterium]|nr:hypothetical protein [Mycobacteriales bacterium]